MSNENKEIEKFSEDICKACRTRYKCKNKYPCAMAEIVAKELYQKNGYRKNKNIIKDSYIEKENIRKQNGKRVSQ